MIGRSAGSAFDQPPRIVAELEAAFVEVNTMHIKIASSEIVRQL
jgi:hypothetical protein